MNWTKINKATRGLKFEKDYRAAPTISLVIQKLPKIKQEDNESVNIYVSRCAEMLLELK